MSKLTSRIAVVAIVIFWATMTGMLLHREVFLPGVPPGSKGIITPLLHELPYENWMGIYYHDTKVGYTYTSIDDYDRGGQPEYLIYNRTLMRLPVFGENRQVDIRGFLKVGTGFEVRDFAFKMRSGEHRLRLSGQMDGKTLSVDMVSGGKVFKQTFPIEGNVNISNTLSPLTFFPDLRPGVEYSMEIIDPITVSVDEARVKIVGKEQYFHQDELVDTYVVRVRYRDLTVKAWVTESGEVLRQEAPLGWSMVREDRGTAYEFDRGTPSFQTDLLKVTTVASNVQFPRPEEIGYLKLKVLGVDISYFDLVGGNQRMLDSGTGIIEVASRKPQQDEIRALPILDEDVQEFLEPTLFTQSDDPGIRRIAHEVIGDEQDSWKAAQKLNEWVYKNLSKRITVSIPSAVDVLQLREGDCNEHTVLYTAMARAVGIPTKVAVGLVYSQGRFYYHAWPEVFVGRWVPIDPTLNQVVADATHIRLIEGELREQMKIVRLLGRIRLEILEHRHSPVKEGEPLQRS